jgi:glycerol uptake facilitator-like aquaporin
LARTLTDTFAGIAPHSAPFFVVGQVLGATAGGALFGWLLTQPAAVQDAP